MLVPAPSRGDLDIQRIVARTPSKHTLCARRIRNEYCRIARPARVRPRRYRLSGDPRCRVDDLAYACPFLTPEIEGRSASIMFKKLQCKHMRIRQIAHMHVIPNTSAIRCREIVPEYLNEWP